MTDVFIYEFLYRGNDDPSPVDDTWHVQLARWTTDIRGDQKLEVSPALNPKVAAEMGFTLERVLADLNQNALVTITTLTTALVSKDQEIERVREGADERAKAVADETQRVAQEAIQAATDAALVATKAALVKQRDAEALAKSAKDDLLTLENEFRRYKDGVADDRLQMKRDFAELLKKIARMTVREQTDYWRTLPWENL